MTVRLRKHRQGDLSLDDGIGEYILSCQVEGRSPSTISWYRQKLKYLDTFLMESGHSGLLSSIGTTDLRAFLLHLQSERRANLERTSGQAEAGGLSTQTVLGYFRTLRAFFRWAVREALLEESPMGGIRPPKAPQMLMRSFTEREVRALLHAFDRSTPIGFRDYVMTLLLLDTGIRVSELTGLSMFALHRAEGYFQVVGKGRKERVVPVGYTARRMLSRYINKYRPEPALPTVNNVFLTEGGWPLKTDWVYKVIARACRRVGIQGRRIGPHTLRHTFARNFLMNGGDLLTLQRILGHSSLDVVRLYVNLSTKDLLHQQSQYSPVDILYSSAMRATRDAAELH